MFNRTIIATSTINSKGSVFWLAIFNLNPDEAVILFRYQIIPSRFRERSRNLPTLFC